MRVRLEKDGIVLALDAPPIARGGEAAILALPDRPTHLAKLYHKPAPEHADKLAAMIAAPPDDPTARNGHASIAWPIQRLLDADNGGCVGFVMPRVDKALPLFEAYNPKSRLQTWPLFHYGYLVRTARNLSAAVRALHARGYVLGDLNESNVLVNAQALVSVVDTDSFQVRDGQRLFRCTVGKPEYAAPEIQNVNFAEVDRKPEQDAFALAVLIFQLLMQGAHPFAGRFTGAGEPETLARRIAAGHWPYARGRKVLYEPNPTAPPFAVLPFAVRELMRQCFEEGHDRPASRPSATDWHRALTDADAELTDCVVNSQHHFPKSLDACPWCELTAKQGRDPFPAKGKAPTGSEKSGKHAPVASAVTAAKSAAAAPRPVAVEVRPNPRQPAPSRRFEREPAAPAFLSTPWPWVIGAGAAAVVLLFLGAMVGVAAMLLWPAKPPPVVYAPPMRVPAPIDDPFPARPILPPGAMQPGPWPPGAGEAGGPAAPDGPAVAPGQPFIPGPGPAAPRRAPDVLQPDEARVAVLHLQAASYVFSKDLRFVLTFKNGLGPAPDPLAGPIPMAPPPGVVGPGNPAFGPPALSRVLPDPKNPNRLQRLNGGRPLMDKNSLNLDWTPTDSEMVWVGVDSPANLDGLSLAQQALPVRAAEIVASFPLKKQVEEFRTALGLNSDADVLAAQAADIGAEAAAPAFRFLGVALERRELDVVGRPVGPNEGWTPLDADGAYRDLRLLCGGRTEVDDPALQPVLSPELAMPRLPTLGGQFTPPVEAYPPLERSLAHLAAMLGAPPAAPAGPLDLPPPLVPRPGGPAAMRPPGGPAPEIPEYCLIRIFDTTIEAGKTYEYRLRVRMADPGGVPLDPAGGPRAAGKELAAKDWYVVPEKATALPETCIYAVDQKDLDAADPARPPGTPRPYYQPVLVGQTVLQLHRWFDYAATKGRGDLAVGDWWIAERVIAARGEAVHPPRVPAPYWRPALNRFVLASDPPKPGGPKPKGPPTIDAPFFPNGEEPILVDFTGGDATYTRSHPPADDAAAPADKPAPIRDKTPSEVLIYSADGRLLLHNPGRDAADPERVARLNAYRDAIQQAPLPDVRPMNPFGN